MPRTKADIERDIESCSKRLQEIWKPFNEYESNRLRGYGGDREYQMSLENQARNNSVGLRNQIDRLRDELDEYSRDPVAYQKKQVCIDENNRREQERIAKENRREQERIAYEKKREQVRISVEKLHEQNRIAKMTEIASSKSNFEIAQKLKPIREHFSQYQDCFSAGNGHMSRLTSDGNVVSGGIWANFSNRKVLCNTQNWHKVVAISSGEGTIGLKADGSVIADGCQFQKENLHIAREYRRAINSWYNIIAVSASCSADYPFDYNFVGLKSDGTVIAYGHKFNRKPVGYSAVIARWCNIVAISAGAFHVIGLKKDGTVVAVGDRWGNQRNGNDFCDTRDWREMVAVSAGKRHTVGLKADGRVVAVGDNEDGQCETQYWENVVAISAEPSQTIGLKANGTVVATGKNKGFCTNWKDILAISGKSGLKTDGTIVSSYTADYYKDLSNIPLVTKIQLREKFKLCSYCGSKLSFSKKCKSPICGK